MASLPRYLADLAGTMLSTFRIRPGPVAGPPVSGYHLKGEIYIDSNGAMWNCVASGTPGTWVGAGSSTVTVPLGNGPGQVIESISVPGPAVLVWDVMLTDGTNVQYSCVSASTDGTLANYNQGRIVELGSNIPEVYVDIAANTLQLLADTGAPGWTAVVRRYAAS